MDNISFSEFKPTHTLELFVGYWQLLDIAWPQQIPIKDVDNPKTSQDTTKVKIEVMLKILPPLCFMYFITQTLSPCFASKSFTCKTKAFPNVYTTSKKSNSYMTRFPLGIQEMNNNHKISTPLRKIQRSKLLLQVHESRVEITNYFLVFSTILGKISSFSCCFDGKLKQGLNLKINL